MTQISLSGKTSFGNILEYLKLMRPANIITAIADVWAGYVIITALAAESFSIIPPVGLIIATIGLYGGGVVFNDFFDLALDKKERPERPIPSGKVSLMNAGLLGSFLLIIGISAAFTINIESGLMAVIIAILAIFYNAFSKHNAFFGPLNMGLCRSGNLLLGTLFLPALFMEVSYLALIPLIYIFAITLISRGEVSGGSSSSILAALIMYSSIALTLLWIGIQHNTFMLLLLFVSIWVGFAFLPLIKAMLHPYARNIRKAVKMGVISLVILNACLAAAFSGWGNGLIILCFLPLSFLLSRIFSVT